MTGAAASRHGSDEVLRLDNQLCFLVYRLQRGITDLYRPVLAELGLTYPQYLVMLALWEDSPLTVGEIGERLRLDSGTLSPLLKRLEAAGLVRRARSTTDERTVDVSLTPAGARLRSRAREVPPRVGGCLAGSVADYRQARALLTDLLERVEGCGPA